MFWRLWFILVIVHGVNIIDAQDLRFLHPRQNYEVDRGSSLEINCQVNHEEAEVFLWHLIAHDLSAYEMPVDNVKLSQQGMSFTLLNAAFHDTGLYECVAVLGNGNRAVHAIADVTVKAPFPTLLHNGTQLYKLQYDASKIKDSKPVVIFDFKSPYRVSVKETREVKLGFRTKGLQPIELTWKKDNKEIEEDHGIKISESQIILVPPFSTSQSGSFEVMACNPRGCTFRGMQIHFYVPKGKEETKEVSKKWMIYAGLILTLIAIVAIGVTGLVLKKMGFDLKRTSQRLTEEAKKTKKQFRRGSKTKSGSIWNYEGIPTKQPDGVPLNYNQTLSPAIPHKPRQITKQWPDSNQQAIYENIQDIKLTADYLQQDNIYEDMNDVREKVEEVKRDFSDNVGKERQLDRLYEDMNDVREKVEEVKRDFSDNVGKERQLDQQEDEDIYQSMTDLAIYSLPRKQYEDTKVRETTNENFQDRFITEQRYEEEDIYQSMTDIVIPTVNHTEVGQNLYGDMATLENHEENERSNADHVQTPSPSIEDDG